MVQSGAVTVLQNAEPIDQIHTSPETEDMEITWETTPLSHTAYDVLIEFPENDDTTPESIKDTIETTLSPTPYISVLLGIGTRTSKTGRITPVAAITIDG